MNRRNFLNTIALTPWFSAFPLSRVWAESSGYQRLLILIELKGGNDGLNTVIPYSDEAYYALRPKLAIAREQVLQLSDRFGVHPALEPLLPLWKDKQWAMIQGVGYPSPNLSHFRSIEIWDTASKSDEYLQEGWLTRCFAKQPAPRSLVADGVIVGSADLGPLAGAGTRAITLSSAEQFLKQARLADAQGAARNKALRHILKVEADILQAANRLKTDYVFKSEFPQGQFGAAVKTACQVVASEPGVAVVRVTLNGFDTHNNQLGTHANLLKEFAQGIVAFKNALTELNKWDEALLLTYAEFGRRPKENLSNGTDHGTANVHFIFGGRVKGGFYGEQPSLERLEGDGNMKYSVDFRSLYATVLDRWWGINSSEVLGEKFAVLPLLSG